MIDLHTLRHLATGVGGHWGFQLSAALLTPGGPTWTNLCCIDSKNTAYVYHRLKIWDVKE